MPAADKPLTIGLVFDDSLDRPDGVQQQIKLLGEWLTTKGHSVHYLVGETKDFKPAGPSLHSLTKNIAVIANQNRLSLPLPVRKSHLTRLFNDIDFDVVHVMLPCSPWLGGPIVKLALEKRIGLVGTFHTYPANWLQRVGSRAYGWWLAPKLRRFGVITSVSAATAEYARRSFGVSSQVVPNFIETGRFLSAKPDPNLRSGAKFVVLFMGRLVERKGAKYLLQAAAKLSPALLEDIKIIIAGDGPQRTELERQVNELDLGSKVDFAGFVPEAGKPAYFASADLAVFPAVGGEAFGIVLIEAMAAGALTLGGENPGYASVLAPFEQTLFTPQDTQALAERINQFGQHQSRRQSLAHKQRDYAKRFDIDTVGDEIITLYQQAIAAAEQ